MAWTAPMTFIANAAITAAQMNTYLRDNLLETMPAKATETGGAFFVTTGTNQIAERVIKSARVETNQSTTSTTFTSTTTVSPGSMPLATSAAAREQTVCQTASREKRLSDRTSTSPAVSGKPATIAGSSAAGEAVVKERSGCCSG